MDENHRDSWDDVLQMGSVMREIDSYDDVLQMGSVMREIVLRPYSTVYSSALNRLDGFDDMRPFPRGFKGSYTLVRASVTRRRYDKIVAICGLDSVDQGREYPNLDSVDQGSVGSNPDHRWMITIKIPAEKFDEVLMLDTYCTGEIGLHKFGDFRTFIWGPANETKPIFLEQIEQAFIFYGTKDVFEKLKAWKRRCEEISRRIQNQKTGTTRRLAEEAAAERDKYQASVENTEGTSSGASAPKKARQEASVENTDGTSSGASASQKARQEVTEDDITMDQTDPGADGSDEVDYHNGRYSGDFIEEGIIGEGGFGIVVKARNKMDKYVYAVKKVFKKAGDDLSMKQVLREVEVLARLSHPNIITYKQAWVEEATASFSRHWGSSNSGTMGRDGSASDGADHSTPGESSEENVSESEDIHCLLYIQMELCGKSLDDTLQSWIEQSAYLYLSDTLKNAVLIIIKKLVEALCYIHSKGIIHRDVKPANIFFVRSERMEPRTILQAQDEVLVKLGDFGLATQTTEPTYWNGLQPYYLCYGLTKGVGTAIYAAPEQMTENIYTNTVDIYSLGVVLAELLCLFPTMHERCELERFRRGGAPDRLEELSKKEEYLVYTIKRMCHRSFILRPSAELLLESGLVVTKDTILNESQEKEEMLSLLTRYTYLRLEEAEDF